MEAQALIRTAIRTADASCFVEENGTCANPAVSNQEQSSKAWLRFPLVAASTALIAGAVTVLAVASIPKSGGGGAVSLDEERALVVGDFLSIAVDGFDLEPNTGCGNWDDLLLTTRGDAPTVSSAKECADLCRANDRCLQFNFQAGPLRSGRCPASKIGDQRGKGSCYMYRERVQPLKCEKLPNTCWDLYTWKNHFAPRHSEVVCPVIGALMLNGDLVPDPIIGNITRNQTRDAFLRVGISQRTADSTIASNFLSDRCPTCTLSVNPLAMNVIVPGVTHNPPGPHEHFRSTGLRDNQLTPAPYPAAVANCLSAPHIWNLERNMCISKTWDCDLPAAGGTCASFTNPDGETRPRFPSNDVAEDRRPSTCPPGTSGMDKCDSALFGAINFMFQEFATPTGEKGLLPNEHYRALWLEGTYTPDFVARSPRHCVQVGEATDGHFGCATCLAQVDETQPVTMERYCRCILSKELSASELATAPKWTQWCMANGSQVLFGAMGEYDKAQGVNVANSAPVPAA